ncbi:MAG: EthD family reductase [Pseudomonadota bacterium]
MHKLFALYKKPDDVEAFMRYYEETHIPLVEKVPGLAAARVNRVTADPFGGEPAYFLIAELCFPDKATFDAAMASPENKAVGQDLANFAKGLVTLVIAEE